MSKLSETQKEAITSKLNEKYYFNRKEIQPFSGHGLQELVAAVLHRREYSMIICGAGRSLGKSLPEITVAFFTDATKIGFAEGRELNEVVTVAAAQALGVVQLEKEKIQEIDYERYPDNERSYTLGAIEAEV